MVQESFKLMIAYCKEQRQSKIEHIGRYLGLSGKEFDLLGNKLDFIFKEFAEVIFG